MSTEPESVPAEVSEQDWTEQNQPTAPLEADGAAPVVPADAVEVTEEADVADQIDQEREAYTTDDEDR